MPLAVSAPHVGLHRDPIERADLAPASLVERIRGLYPGLRLRPEALPLIVHLLMTPDVEPPGRTAPIPYGLLGDAAGAPPHRVEQRNFRAEAYLETVRQALSKDAARPAALGLVPYDPTRHQSRRARLLNLDSETERMAEQARQTTSLVHERWVIVTATGAWLLNDKTARQRRDALLASLPEYDNTPALSRRLQGHLNTRSAASFSALKQAAASPEVVSQVRKLYSDSAKYDRTLATLRDIQVMPVPVYGPSPRTARIHARGRSMASLPSAIRQLITERLGWVELDLAHAQLAANARLWDVQGALESLGNPDYRFWDDLMEWLGADPEALKASGEYGALKSALKPSVHGLSFGMGKDRIRRLGTDKRKQADPDIVQTVTSTTNGTFKAAGARLLSHPVLAAMYAARERLCAEIKRAGGRTDMFGRYLELGPTDNPGRLLALDAQGAELQLLEPVIEMSIADPLTQRREFQIMLWQHDGFTVKPRDRQRVRVCRTIQVIQEAVSERATELGIPTHLVVDVGPECQ